MQSIQIPLDASKKAGLGINVEKTALTYMSTSATKTHDRIIMRQPMHPWKMRKHFGTPITNQNYIYNVVKGIKYRIRYFLSYASEPKD
jgi:hypothetical protein